MIFFERFFMGEKAILGEIMRGLMVGKWVGFQYKKNFGACAKWETLYTVTSFLNFEWTSVSR